VRRVCYIPHGLHSLELLVNFEHSLSTSRLIRYCILSKIFFVSLRRECFESERDVTSYFVIQLIIFREMLETYQLESYLF
jgi:hypothetical protein